MKRFRSKITKGNVLGATVSALMYVLRKKDIPNIPLVDRQLFGQHVQVQMSVPLIDELNPKNIQRRLKGTAIFVSTNALLGCVMAVNPYGVVIGIAFSTLLTSRYLANSSYKMDITAKQVPEVVWTIDIDQQSVKKPKIVMPTVNLKQEISRIPTETDLLVYNHQHKVGEDSCVPQETKTLGLLSDPKKFVLGTQIDEVVSMQDMTQLDVSFADGFDLPIPPNAKICDKMTPEETKPNCQLRGSNLHSNSELSCKPRKAVP